MRCRRCARNPKPENQRAGAGIERNWTKAMSQLEGTALILCPGCAVEYPEGYLSPFETKFGKRTLPVCGCCALELANRARINVGGQTVFCFQRGTMGERLRRLAIDWRRETHAIAKTPVAVQLP